VAPTDGERDDQRCHHELTVPATGFWP